MKVWKSFSNPVFTPLQPLKTSSYHRTTSSFCVPLKRKSGSRLQAVSHHLVNLGFRILRSTGGKRNLQQEENKALLESKIKSCSFWTNFANYAWNVTIFAPKLLDVETGWNKNYHSNANYNKLYLARKFNGFFYFLSHYSKSPYFVQKWKKGNIFVHLGVKICIFGMKSTEKHLLEWLTLYKLGWVNFHRHQKFKLGFCPNLLFGQKSDF